MSHRRVIGGSGPPPRVIGDLSGQPLTPQRVISGDGLHEGYVPVPDVINLRLRDAADVDMTGAADGAVLVFRSADQIFEATRETRELLMDGGNF